MALVGLYLLCIKDGFSIGKGDILVSGILSGIPALFFEKPQFSSLLAAWQPLLYAGITSCGVAYTLQIVGCVIMFCTIILAQLPQKNAPKTVKSSESLS